MKLTGERPAGEAALCVELEESLRGAALAFCEANPSCNNDLLLAVLTSLAIEATRQGDGSLEFLTDFVERVWRRTDRDPSDPGAMNE